MSEKNMVVFSVFGLKLDKLNELLKDLITKKNNGEIKIIDLKYGLCKVILLLPKNIHASTRSAFIKKVMGKIEDNVFSYSDKTLGEVVVNALLARGKTVATAESFTGGGVSRAIVGIENASRVFSQGFVCYSNNSKIKTLRVDENLINRYGAVSIETIYEMAANLVEITGADYVIATSGNAGPSAEKQGQAGKVFIAVGNSKSIHIYPEFIEGTREEVIEYSINFALFKLYKELTKDEFKEMLRVQE